MYLREIIKNLEDKVYKMFEDDVIRNLIDSKDKDYLIAKLSRLLSSL